jgi:membrane protease YdiL (CAAX protease family)/predicted RNA-binding Zn-ribbon protein involved in translation (DUF1610 family)
MSDKNDNLVNYCVYCGAKVEKGKAYCPKCGKLIIEIKPTKEKTLKEPIVERSLSSGKIDISRKCPSCGSVITSTILDQCPICNTLLEPLPEFQKVRPARTGFVFTKERLEPEQRFMLKHDTWNLKEGINVFTNSILVYITVQLFLIMFLWFQLGSNDTNQTLGSEITIFLILISQIPGILLGVFPLWYITANKHSFEKLGFPIKDKKLILAFIIGISGGIGLIIINILSNFINIYIYELINGLGLNLFDIQEYMEMESKAIQNAGFWIIILVVELILATISVEIVFRGVLHNTLRERFGTEKINGRIITILIVALVYSGIYLLFSFPIGIFFIVSNFLVFIFLGILYEINQNIYNTIIASICYDILLILVILYL